MRIPNHSPATALTCLFVLINKDKTFLFLMHSSPGNGNYCLGNRPAAIAPINIPDTFDVKYVGIFDTEASSKGKAMMAFTCAINTINSNRMI